MPIRFAIVLNIFVGGTLLSQNVGLATFFSTVTHLQSLKKHLPSSLNSVSADKKACYHKPSGNGFYYKYFIFPPHSLDVNTLITWKEGDKIGKPLEKNEEFIELTIKTSVSSLKEYDLTKKKYEELIVEFGSPQYKNEDYLIYQSNNFYLIILTDKTKVLSFRVLKSGKKFISIEEMKREGILL